MKTHLAKTLEENGHTEGHYTLRQESLDRVMVQLAKTLSYTHADAMAEWESEVLHKSTEKFALNGEAEIVVEAKYTKSGESEVYYFDDEDFILTVEE